MPRCVADVEQDSDDLSFIPKLIGPSVCKICGWDIDAVNAIPDQRSVHQTLATAVYAMVVLRPLPERDGEGAVQVRPSEVTQNT